MKRGQFVKLPEEDAKRQHPGLVIASFGANKKEKSDATERSPREPSPMADVKEAHRQIPVARDDWRLLGCRVRPGVHKHGPHMRYIVGFVLLVNDRIGDWQIDAIRRRPVCYYLGYVGERRLSFGDEWRGVSGWSYHFLCHLLAPQSGGDPPTWVGVRMVLQMVSGNSESRNDQRVLL